MTAIEIPLETMPLSERLALLNRIRKTLPPNTPEDEAHVEMPDWHAGVLEERLKEADSPDAVWLTLDEAKERLDRRFK
ncbi:MAG: hypothetical protein JWO08_1463 [Verrucomicrobiaceae bacterium]|nr:hypothetical protein [Verrucomicrobiaceae bacterium]